jgi:hypothetical protein
MVHDDVRAELDLSATPGRLYHGRDLKPEACTAELELGTKK